MRSVDEVDYPSQVADWRRRQPATRWADEFRSLGLELDSGLVLDCGCGPGRYGRLLAQEGATVIGLDREAACLGEARGRPAPYKLLVQGDVSRLPFAEGTFAIVLLRYVLHHFPIDQRGQVLGGIRRTIAPTGSLVIETAFPDQFKHHYDHRIYPPLTAAMAAMYADRPALVAQLHAAGFRHVRMVETTQEWAPYPSVREPLEKSQRLVESGEGPTAWLRLSARQRQAFHSARLAALPSLFGTGPVPRVWRGTFVLAGSA